MFSVAQRWPGLAPLILDLHDLPYMLAVEAAANEAREMMNAALGEG